MDIYWMPGSAKFTIVVFVKTTGDSTTLGKDVLCCRVQENLKSYYRENSKSQVDLAPDSQQSHMAYLMQEIPTLGINQYMRWNQ